MDTNKFAGIATPIHDFLEKTTKKCFVRCYMPGHKGSENPFDITEIEGADSLYDTDFFSKNAGIIAKSEQNASKLFGSEQTLYSCGGGTLAIQTMLALAKEKGGGRDHVLAARYSHRSFINTCVLLGLTPTWVYPQEYMSAAVTAQDIAAKLNSRTLAVFVNSIDCYGGMSDIAAIAEVCHAADMPLIVDNTHGAYLKFAPVDLHPITLGADMCADSAHKTLPVLTGGAYLHIANKKYCKSAKQLESLFGSSSPSYLILDSLDRCNAEIANHPKKIGELCRKISSLKAKLCDAGYALSTSDYLRITLDCTAMNTTGYVLSAMLREFAIECEYADKYRCVLLFGYGTTDIDLDTVWQVLSANPPMSFAVQNPPAMPKHIKPQWGCVPTKAYFSEFTTVPVMKAVGKICARSASPCPPGIPLVMPGEKITVDCARALKDMGINELSVVI